MFRNYFKVAIRNLRKNKAHSFINIAGLSTGMAVAMLIGLWVWNELSFDKNHKNHKRIAQVIQNVTNNGEVATWRSVPYPLAEELRKNYGEDFKMVVMGTGNQRVLSVGDKNLTRTGSFFEPRLPELLTLNMIRGNWDGLKDPSSIMLSESVAKAFFGNDDPMGKMMKIDNRMDVKVTGVYEDLPENSSFRETQFLAPWELYYNNTEWIKTIRDPWRPNSFMIFTLLADNADFKAVSAKIKDAKLKKVNPELAKKKPELFLHPMDQWHLYADFKNGVNAGGSIKYVWMFGIIGVFVLLLACINFMNLSTARSEKRAKEVGIRKAVGSLRSQLIYQFFSESVITAILSFALAVLLVQILLPFFSEVAGKSMSVPWSNPLFWTICLAFTILTGLIAGSYPAFYLSSFRPVKILKGSFKAGRWAAVPRKVLVVVQFSVCVSMIIGTIIVFRQIQFAKNRPVGYDTNGLISIPTVSGDIHKHYDAVKNELFQSKAVTGIAESGSPPTQIWGSSSAFSWKGKDPNLSIDFSQTDVSFEYGKTVGWQFKQGRDFSKDLASDSSGFVLNEAAVKFMGMQNPIGETMTWAGQTFQVIGVIEDMITHSPYDPVKPTIFFLNNSGSNFVLLKLNPDMSAREALAKIEPIFKKFNPSQPFEYQFIDEEYAKKFGSEERIGKLASFFAILAILISCLGLFGMASFMAEQRVKEIGVRKVLGASVFNVWHLLSRDFIILVIISLFIAIPTAYYYMHSWLQNYQYRSEITWWIFGAAGSGAILITLVTVSFQSVRAALANPVKSLRTE